MMVEFQTVLTDPASNDHVLINLKKNAISVGINTFTVYTYDLAGRLVTAVIDGHTYRRSLDNRIMEKWSVPRREGRERVRLWLSPERKRSLLDGIHSQMRALFTLIQKRQFEVVSGTASVTETPGSVLPALSKILSFDADQLEQDARKFASIYRPVGILPPDLYLSLVLQATAGCSYSRCSYCNFYEHQAFRVKSSQEFDAHVGAVKDYFSETLPLRNALFLGEGNVLNLPPKTLHSFFGTVNDSFVFSGSKPESGVGDSKPQLRGIYSFMTAFRKNRACADDFAELRAQNLRRVYVGMESGSNPLLAFLKKPGRAENAIELIRTIKAGGVNAGVIILLGAGGSIFGHSHTEDTVSAIREMPLGAGDIIYFSPMNALPGTQYAEDMASHGISPLTPGEMTAQKKEMIEGFRSARNGEAPQMASYEIDEFLY